MRGRKGQATAVGGVFLVLLIAIFVGFLLYQLENQHRYFSLAMETMEERKNMFSEKIAATANYKISKTYDGTDAGIIHVVTGKILSGSNSSLNNKGSDYIIVDSGVVLNLTTRGGTVTQSKNVIENGDFDNKWTPWKYNPKRYWYLAPYDSDIAARYYAIVPKKKIQIAYLQQEFEIPDNIDSATLKFSFKMGWFWIFNCLGNISSDDFRIDVYIDNIKIATYDLTNPSDCDNWRDSGRINVTNYLSTPGRHTIKFEVRVRNTSKYPIVIFEVWIDKVSLNVTYSTQGESYSMVMYGFDSQVNIDLTDYYVLDGILLMETNESLVFEVYSFDEYNNIWSLENKFITPANEWFNITFIGEKTRIYATSQKPFKVTVDYLHVETEELNPNGFEVQIKNPGTSEVYVVACWIRNSNNAWRFKVEKIVTPNENITLTFPLVLNKGETYEIRVVTRYNVFKSYFTP